MTQISRDQFNQGLLKFLQASPTPYHAVANMRQALEAAGYTALEETDAWAVQKGGKHFVIRNGSSIVAFRLGETDLAQGGVHMLGAHTDSPCLKVKPNADLYRNGYWQLGLEVYGGVLLNPWFDRDLSMAGRVTCLDKSGEIHNVLIDFEQPVAVIPSLAIHLDRKANDNRSINKQTDLPVILSLSSEEKPVFKELLKDRVLQQGVLDGCEQVLEYEISLYDCHPPAQIGLQGDFIASARLDNLLSCYVGLQALLEASESQGAAKHSSLLVCNDHEEVGSTSAVGAGGTLLSDCLARLCGSHEALVRTLQQSMLISADNAHGVHPNFAAKHDDKHGPVLNEGVVLKMNANQRYASNSETVARFQRYADRVGAPVQRFVVRSDMGCGSTIGPITAAELGVATIDIGVPTFAMHSIRELAGSEDAHQLAGIVRAFYQRA